MSQQTANEVLDRTRRIETRLTQLMIALGVNSGRSQKPTWGDAAPGRHGSVTVPSPHSTLREILDEIPPLKSGMPIDIYLGDERIAVITKV